MVGFGLAAVERDRRAPFVLGGLGVLAVAAAVRWTTAGVRGSAVGSVLLAVNGVALLALAAVRTDRIDGPDDFRSLSWTGWVHVGAAAIGLLAAVAAMLLLTWTFARHPDLRSFAP